MKQNTWNIWQTLAFTSLFVVALLAADFGSGKGVFNGTAPASVLSFGNAPSQAVKTNGGGDAW